MTALSFVATRVALAALVLPAFAAPAHALPHFGVHRTPVAATDDDRIAVTLYNSAQSFRDVKVGDKTYTLLPHNEIAIKAPAGTVVYTETTGSLHRKGDAIVTLTPESQNKRITLN